MTAQIDWLPNGTPEIADVIWGCDWFGIPLPEDARVRTVKIYNGDISKAVRSAFGGCDERFFEYATFSVFFRDGRSPESLTNI